MTDVSRRAFNQQTVGSLLTLSLLETLYATDAFAAEIKPVTARWLAEVDELGRDLKGQKIGEVQWQEKVEGLFSKVELAELLKFIEFDKLIKGLSFRDKGEKTLRPRFPKVEGLPTNLVFGNQMFALKKDRSVVPHGHDNMATAFLVLKGSFQGRHYDRLEDTKDHMIIKPTIDQSFTVGQYSSVSDKKDNVHWFKATSETGFIFNIHILGVTEGRRTKRVYVDPNGEKLAGGKIRGRRIGASEAYRLYG